MSRAPVRPRRPGQWGMPIRTQGSPQDCLRVTFQPPGRAALLGCSAQVILRRTLRTRIGHPVGEDPTPGSRRIMRDHELVAPRLESRSPGTSLGFLFCPHS